MDAPENSVIDVLTDTRLSRFADRIGNFYLFLFLFSRYARNVITKLPKVIIKLIIPMKIEIPVLENLH